MAHVIAPQRFSVEAYGEAHAPYALNLALCVLLFNRDGALSAFTGTDQPCPAEVAGVTLAEETLATVLIEVEQIETACTRIIIAAHIEAVERLSPRSAALRHSPTIHRLTYSARALGFGNSATFIDEDVVHGVELLVLDRVEENWLVDDDRRPAPYPELVKLARSHDIELTPFEI